MALKDWRPFAECQPQNGSRYLLKNTHKDGSASFMICFYDTNGWESTLDGESYALIDISYFPVTHFIELDPQ